MHNSTEKLLIVGPAWVGDMVMSQALYRHLQAARPGCVIDVAAPPWSAPLVERMSEVRRVLELPAAHGELALARRYRLGRVLRAEAYTQAIVLPNSFKSALLPWFARIPRRTGWRGEMRYGLLNDVRRLDTAALPTMAQRFVALGTDPGAATPEVPPPQLRVEGSRARELAAHCGLAPDRPLLALCPGAEFGAAKRWPEASFAAVARAALARGWQVACFGSGADRETALRIAQLSQPAGDCRNLAGATSLADVIDLLSLSTAVVSNDSGLMHIAAALGRPLVALYGPTSPDFTPPLAPAARVLRVEVDCAPCFQRDCPLGHHDCMRKLSPERVDAELQALTQSAGIAV